MHALELLLPNMYMGGFFGVVNGMNMGIERIKSARNDLIGSERHPNETLASMHPLSTSDAALVCRQHDCHKRMHRMFTERV